MKTAGMWIAATIVFFYGSSKLGPTPSDNNLLGLVLMAVAFGVPMYFTVRKIGKNAEARNAHFVSTKALYEKTLFDLQEDPTNSAKQQKALEKGREYYSFLHPNTYDVSANGVGSNFRDNSGIVEMKVQSDIQARLGKGKVS